MLFKPQKKPRQFDYTPTNPNEEKGIKSSEKRIKFRRSKRTQKKSQVPIILIILLMIVIVIILYIRRL